MARGQHRSQTEVRKLQRAAVEFLTGEWEADGLSSQDANEVARMLVYGQKPMALKELITIGEELDY